MMCGNWNRPRFSTLQNIGTATTCLPKGLVPSATIKVLGLGRKGSAPLQIEAFRTGRARSLRIPDATAAEGAVAAILLRSMPSVADVRIGHTTASEREEFDRQLDLWKVYNSKRWQAHEAAGVRRADRRRLEPVR